MLRLAEIFFYRLSSSVFAILFVLDPARSEMRANLYGQKGPKGVVFREKDRQESWGSSGCFGGQRVNVRTFACENAGYA